MSEDLEREFPSVSPKSGERQGHIDPFSDPAVQQEIESTKPPHSAERALDDFVREKVAEYGLNHPNATPEELAAAEGGIRATAEMLLRAPNLMAVDGQVSSDNMEAARHDQEVIEVADDAGELATEQEVAISEGDLIEGSEQQAPLHMAIEAAAEVGIKDESELQQIGVLLGPREKPLDQRDLLYALIQRKGYRSTPAELLGIVRNYLKESIKAREKGLLFHYHQTAVGNLESIVRDGVLLSQDEQRARGEKFDSGGARPDVVQMTRDKYDSDGNLLDAGLKETSNNLIARGGLAFVFEDSVMDESDYDCIGEYPNLPSIPLENLIAVVVNDEKDMQPVREKLIKGRINARVMLRSDWLKGYSRAKSNRI